MFQESNWWARQFVETMKEMALADHQFVLTRDVSHLDRVTLLCEQLNHAYKMSISLEDYVKFGRARLANPAPPHFRYKAYEL